MRTVQVVITVVGSILFCWFFGPLLWKGIFNIGTATGILISLLILCYGVFFGNINDRILLLWNGRGTRKICVALLVIAAVIAAIVLVETVLMVRSAFQVPPENTAAVVLGCSVKGGTKPSKILEERIDTAYEYLTENKDAVCILSGGQGSDEDITEAQCMYGILTKRGINKDRLILEERSTTTEENLKYTREILDERGLDPVVTIITSEFHEYRANQMAEKLRIKSYSTPAHTFFVYFPTYYVRELYGILYYELCHR